MLIGMMICPIIIIYFPGYFWCEWLEGEHYSIDYRRGKNWKGGEDWVPGMHGPMIRKKRR